MKRRKSPRKKIIDKTLAIIRKLKKIEYKDKCFFCGKHQSQLRFKLSNFHILSVGAHPRTELLYENIVLACWAPYYYSKQCHNLWEKRDEKARPIMEEKLRAVFGSDFKDKLLITERTSPPLNKFRAEQLYLFYKRKELFIKVCEES